MSSQIGKNIDAKIEQLKLMIDTPRLFLIEYYSELRNKIDEEYLKKEQKITTDEKKQWIKMIDKIDSFENENMKQLHPNPITETTANQINSLIKEIQEQKYACNYYEFILDREIEKIKKILFLNKTILLFKYSDRNQHDEVIKFICPNELITKENADKHYLLISNNHYLYLYWTTRFFDPENYYFSREFLTHLFLKDKYESIQNQIIDIDLELSNSLEEINESSLGYKSINFDTFRNLNSLILIDFSNNELENIDDFIFQDLISLKYLWLNNNSITSVGKNAFKSLNKLEWLDLSGNKIQSFDENTFKDLTSLEILDLENNQIEYIDPSIFQSNSKLRILMTTNRFTLKPVKNLTNEKISNSHPKESVELFGKNLLKNSDAEHGFENWIELHHYFQGKNKLKHRYIITLIKNSKIKRKFDGVENKMVKEENQTFFRNFVISNSVESKYQLIEISEMNLNEVFFSNYKFDVEIGENYFYKCNLDCLYDLKVLLIDEYFQIIDKYHFKHTFKQGEVPVWHTVKYIFKYKEEFKSLKYILFYHAGEITRYVNNRHDTKMKNGYVKLIKSSYVEHQP